MILISIDKYCHYISQLKNTMDTKHALETVKNVTDYKTMKEMYDLCCEKIKIEKEKINNCYVRKIIGDNVIELCDDESKKIFDFIIFNCERKKSKCGNVMEVTLICGEDGDYWGHNGIIYLYDNMTTITTKKCHYAKTYCKACKVFNIVSLVIQEKYDEFKKCDWIV